MKRDEGNFLFFLSRTCKKTYNCILNIEESDKVKKFRDSLFREIDELSCGRSLKQILSISCDAENRSSECSRRIMKENSFYIWKKSEEYLNWKE